MTQSQIHKHRNLRIIVALCRPFTLLTHLCNSLHYGITPPPRSRTQACPICLKYAITYIYEDHALMFPYIRCFVISAVDIYSIYIIYPFQFLSFPSSNTLHLAINTLSTTPYFCLQRLNSLAHPLSTIVYMYKV